MEEFLGDHNASSKRPMPLALFLYVLEHASRACRALRQVRCSLYDWVLCSLLLYVCPRARPARVPRAEAGALSLIGWDVVDAFRAACQHRYIGLVGAALNLLFVLCRY
jgi:hypothetical protein